MPIMFCHIDPFVMNQTVVEMSSDTLETIFAGSMLQIADFMAKAYSTKKYERIILQGQMADDIAEQIRTYALTDYNLNNIEIEVLN